MNKRTLQRKANSKVRKEKKLLHDRKIAKEQFLLDREVEKLQNQNNQIVKADSIEELSRIERSKIAKDKKKYTIAEIKQRRRKLKNGQRRTK